MYRFAFKSAVPTLLYVFSIACCAEVQVEGTSDGFRLLRGGQPYFVKGAGFGERHELLAKIGGNSIRTTNSEHLAYHLDSAQKLGLSVCAGLTMASELDGFDYDILSKNAEQLDHAKKVVLKYKDHPALLLWSAGENVAGNESSESAWRAIEEFALMIHQLDPNHPTMTVVSDVTPQKIKALSQFCPNIDILGVANCAGSGTLAERLRECGWTKPFIVADHGVRSVREATRAAWGAPLEETSTQKADRLLLNYQRNVAPGGHCLGSYASLWGHKQYRTSTWCGMFLKSGESLGAIDALSFAFSGKFPPNRAPRILDLACSAHNKELEPGAAFTAALSAYDDDGDRINVSWEVREESRDLKLGDSVESEPRAHPAALLEAKDLRASFKSPQTPGAYRLFVTVRDTRGHAATANAVFYVKK